MPLLTSLGLSIGDNYFGEDPDFMKNICQGLSKLSNLKTLNISFSTDNLGASTDNILFLVKALKSFSVLEKLILDLSDNIFD